MVLIHVRAVVVRQKVLSWKAGNKRTHSLVIIERCETTVGNKGMEAEECLEMCNKSLDRDSEDKVQCSCMKDETTRHLKKQLLSSKTAGSVNWEKQMVHDTNS